MVGDHVVPTPSSDCGLYVKTRNGIAVHVRFPPDRVAFQVGEVLQVPLAQLFHASELGVECLPACIAGRRGVDGLGWLQARVPAFLPACAWLCVSACVVDCACMRAYTYAWSAAPVSKHAAR